MASSTPRVGLYMPADDGSDPINVATDINDNLEKLDASIGFVPATEALPPGSPFNGLARYNTDSGRASFWRTATATWTQLLSAGSSFLSDVLLGTANKIGIGTLTPSAIVDVIVSNVLTVPLIKFKQASESFQRLEINHDGIKIGGGSVAPEVRIYRPALNQIGIIGSVAMANDLSVSGYTAVNDLDVSGDLTVGGNVTSNLNITGDITGTGAGVFSTRVRTTESSRTSNTTYTVDTFFDTVLAANTAYFIRVLYVYTGAVGGDFKTRWLAPAGAQGHRYALGMATTGTTSFESNMVTTVFPFLSGIIYGAHSTTQAAGAVEEIYISTGGTGGTLQLEWAQGTSSASPTVLKAGTYIEVRKLA